MQTHQASFPSSFGLLAAAAAEGSGPRQWPMEGKGAGPVHVVSEEEFDNQPRASIPRTNFLLVQLEDDVRGTSEPSGFSGAIVGVLSLSSHVLKKSLQLMCLPLVEKNG